MNRSFTFLFLLLCLFILGLGGLYGGAALLLDPAGGLLGVSAELLENLPLSNFILPGLFLLIVMGLTPLALIILLWKRVIWAWPTAVALSLVLILWVTTQLLLWGSPVPIQLTYLGLGFLLLVLNLTPAVRQDSRKMFNHIG